MNIEKTDIREWLSSAVNEKVYYISNPGNAGDAAIALGTYHLFEDLGIEYTSINIKNLPQIEGETVLFGGGGNLIEGLYRDMHDAIAALVSNNRCVLLPHTIFGYQDLIRHTHDNLTIFCREKESYKLCLKLGACKETLFLDDDLAFHIRPEFLAQWIARKGTGTGMCLRTDLESSGRRSIPGENRDISLSWNGCLWQDRMLTECVVASLLAYLSSFEIIETDRLHIGILSSLLRRSVKLFPNKYYKNRAVFETSLVDYPNACFVDTQNNDEEICLSNIAADVNNLVSVRRAASSVSKIKQVYSLHALKLFLMGKIACTRAQRKRYRAKLKELVLGE